MTMLVTSTCFADPRNELVAFVDGHECLDEDGVSFTGDQRGSGRGPGGDAAGIPSRPAVDGQVSAVEDVNGQSHVRCLSLEWVSRRSACVTTVLAAEEQSRIGQEDFCMLGLRAVAGIGKYQKGGIRQVPFQNDGVD